MLLCEHCPPFADLADRRPCVCGLHGHTAGSQYQNNERKTGQAVSGYKGCALHFRLGLLLHHGLSPGCRSGLFHRGHAPPEDVMYSPVRHAGSIFHKGRPIHLTFFITRRCNSGCPFCFYLKNAGAKPVETGELTLEEIGKISGSFGRLLWLAFSGGEIFLRDDLAEISRTFYKNNRPSIMLFPTNGLLPELIRDTLEQVLKDCRKSV